MTTLRVVAVLLVANAVLLILGSRGGGGGAGVERPSWLPSLWIRAGIPLVLASGLWFGQAWAWWAAMAMCAGLLVWIGLASFVLAAGGYFTGDGAASRAVHFSLLLTTWFAALVLLVSTSGRAAGGT